SRYPRATREIRVMEPRLDIRSAGIILAVSIPAFSCSGSSSSEPGSPRNGTGTTSGAGGGAATTSTTSRPRPTSSTPTGRTSAAGTSAGAGGSTTGGGGAPGTGGAGAGACSPLTSVTLGVHVIMDVSWTGDNIRIVAGTGKVHLWNRAKLTINGTMVSGDE